MNQPQRKKVFMWGVGITFYTFADDNNRKQPREEFFRNCEQELNKVNLFFSGTPLMWAKHNVKHMWKCVFTCQDLWILSERLSEAHSRLATFKIKAREVSGSEVRGDIRRSDVKSRTDNIKHIKMAVGELYLSLAFLQKYQVGISGTCAIYLVNYRSFHCKTKSH